MCIWSGAGVDLLRDAGRGEVQATMRELMGEGEKAAAMRPKAPRPESGRARTRWRWRPAGRRSGSSFAVSINHVNALVATFQYARARPGTMSSSSSILTSPCSLTLPPVQVQKCWCHCCCSWITS